METLKETKKETLIDKLTNPFDGLKSNDISDVQDKCTEIAEELFNNFYIKCGEKTFYFAEIEFYYYEKGKLEDEWNKKTYPRTDKKAGELFFHYSGCDLCFESDFEKGIFGGILIRSLKDENGKFITGPTVCMLEMLNLCSKSKQLPEVVPIDGEHKNKCELDKKNPIPRYGIKYKNENLVDEPLCFYDKNLYKKYTNKDEYKEIFEAATWDYDNKKQKKISRYYKRFIK